MTKLTHDTLHDLERGTPALYLWSARVLPVAISLQFLLAGQALYGGLAWGAHAAVGGLVSLPVFALGIGAAAIGRLRGFGWWAGLIVVLYLVQVALGAGGPPAIAYHPFNGTLLLIASIVLLLKVERRRALHA